MGLGDLLEGRGGRAARRPVIEAGFACPQVGLGVGAELWLDWVLFYVQPFSLRCGYARGLIDGDGNQFHLLLGARF